MELASLLIKTFQKLKINIIANINFLVLGMAIIVKPKVYDGI